MQLHGIMRVMGLLCAIMALAMFTSTAWASSTRSAVVAKAASHCSQSAATRHRSQASRGLSSAHVSKVQRICQAARPHMARINHWYSKKYRWTLYLSSHNRGLTCHKLKQKNRLLGPESLCYRARMQVRIHSGKLAHINARIAKLMSKKQVGDMHTPYRAFSSCKDAVKYIFAGRSDESRAEMVVHRESTDNPNAYNGTHMGCAEESEGMRQAHLRGPWNDAYWNVLAMRDVVDDPAYGWCHWDVVNYCLPGGEF